MNLVPSQSLQCKSIPIIHANKSTGAIHYLLSGLREKLEYVPVVYFLKIDPMRTKYVPYRYWFPSKKTLYKTGTGIIP